MGLKFYDNLGGKRVYVCDKCRLYFTNRDEVMSVDFRGATGRAFLFRKVVNVSESRVEAREMMTGRHHVRDIFCNRCGLKVGWMYEYAVETDQRYKEGSYILERKLIRESLGFEDPLIGKQSSDSDSSSIQ